MKKWILLFVLFICVLPASYCRARVPGDNKPDRAAANIRDDIKLLPKMVWQTEKGLFEKQFAPLWGSAALGISLAYLFDDDIDRYIVRNKPFQEPAERFDLWGKYAYSLGWAGLYFGGHLFKNNKLARTGRDILVANLSANIVGTFLWFAIGRQRPMYSNNKHSFKPFDTANLKGTIPPFIIQPSFPSLHTVGIASIATVLTLNYGYAAGLPVYAFMGIVGYSRMALDGHYLSDVVGGFFLGTISSLVVCRLSENERAAGTESGLMIQADFLENRPVLSVVYSF